MRIFLFLSLLLTFSNSLKAQEVEWTSIKAVEDRSSIKITGKVIPQEGALSMESARIQGRIIDLMKREGDHVRKGDPLFTINSPECITLMQEKQIARNQNLPELVQSAQRRETQLGLRTNGNCEILASHSGTLMKRELQLGASFDVGTPLASIMDESRLNVELDVPERELNQLRIGQTVEVYFGNQSEKPLIGKIQMIFPEIDAESRTSKVRLQGLSIPPGTNVNTLVFASIQISGNQSILQVPNSALVFNKNTQYVLKKSNSATNPIAVQVIHESQNYSSVKPLQEGSLKNGDLVAEKGALFLFNQSTESKAGN